MATRLQSQCIITNQNFETQQNIKVKVRRHNTFITKNAIMNAKNNFLK